MKPKVTKVVVLGGTNEFGENIEETLCRELLEEAGVTAEIDELIPHHTSVVWAHTDYDQHTLVFCYLCKLIDKKRIKKDKKISKLIWINPKDIDVQQFLPTCEPFLKHILSL